MILDLDNPEHVEALRWACGDRAQPAPNVYVWFALTTLTDPAAAADIIRRLLERNGLNIRRVHIRMVAGEPYSAFVEWQSRDEMPEDMRPVDRHPYAARSTPFDEAWYQIGPSRLPGIIIGLINAEDQSAALAVLRGYR